MGKKILIGLGAFFAIVLILIITLPFIINVDQYRPQIEQQAQSKLNGKIELGKLQLSLWGQIRIQVDGVKVQDLNGKTILSVGDAFFHLPFTSIFSGAPELTFKMSKPEVNVVKEKDGKFNLQKMLKTELAAQGKEEEKKEESAASSAQSAEGEVELPSIVARSKLSIELSDALVTYIDPSQDLSNKIENFNIRLQNLSLTKPMSIRIWADLDTTLGKTLKVQGPFEITSDLEVKIKGQSFEMLTAQAVINLDQLTVQLPGVFQKRKGALANLSTQLKVTPSDFYLEDATLNFINAKIKSKGEIKSYDKIEQKEASLRFQLKAEPIDLAPWAELADAAHGYELSGMLKLDADVSGPLHELQANALLEIQKLMAKTPGLKVKPELNLLVSFKADQMDRFQFSLKAPKNDLKVSGTVKNVFKSPLAEFQMASSGMDLNELLVLPDPKAKPAASEKTTSAPSGEGSGSGGATAQSGNAPVKDYDAALDPLRKNEMLKKSSGSLGVNIQFIKVYDVLIDKVLSTMTFKDLVFAIQNFQFQIFKGKIQAKSQMDFKPKAPSYEVFAQITDLDTKTAMESELELFKNTIQGKLNFKAQGTGRSFNPDPATRNLDLKGHFIFSNAKFTTIDIGKMVTESVNGALAKVQDKVPQLKGKQLKNMAGRESRYEQIASNFTIKGGIFQAPDFTAKSEKGSGVDLRGNTSLNLLTTDVKAQWSVIDAHNVTGASDISVNIAGQEVKRVLAEKNQPVRFPVSIGCKATAPCYDSKEVPAHFISVATQNLTGAGKAAVTARAKEEAKKVIQKNPEVQKAMEKAPEPAKKLFKKFGL